MFLAVLISDFITRFVTRRTHIVASYCLLLNLREESTVSIILILDVEN